MADWKEVGREGDASVWKPEVGNVLEGVLTEKRANVGANNSGMYVVTTADNNMVAIWETSVLKSKLDQLEIGSEVRLEYLGKRKSKNGPGTYHDFKVQTRPHERTEEEKLFGIE